MTRQTKTPRQRAEEQLAVAERAVERLTTKQDQLEAELRAVVHQVNAAVVRRDYLANHPDLHTPTTTKENTHP